MAGVNGWRTRRAARGPTSMPLPRPFWFIWAGTLVNRICYFVEPFLALYLARSLHLRTPTIGLVLTAFGTGSFISQPIGGLLADHIGRRRTLAPGWSPPPVRTAFSSRRAALR